MSEVRPSSVNKLSPVYWAAALMTEATLASAVTELDFKEASTAALLGSGVGLLDSSARRLLGMKAAQMTVAVIGTAAGLGLNIYSRVRGGGDVVPDNYAEMIGDLASGILGGTGAGAASNVAAPCNQKS